MSALSDYAESGLLNYYFRGQTLNLPTNLSIALTSGVPQDSDTGASLPEIGLTDAGGNNTGYSRLSIGNPQTEGATKFSYTSADANAGSGVIRNVDQYTFATALTDWGHVSGVAIVDSANHGSGNVILKGALQRQRIVYEGENMKLNAGDIAISFK